MNSCTIGLKKPTEIIHVKERQIEINILQKWNSDISSSPKGETYAIFIETFELEKYFLILPEHLWTAIFKLD